MSAGRARRATGHACAVQRFVQQRRPRLTRNKTASGVTGASPSGRTQWRSASLRAAKSAARLRFHKTDTKHRFRCLPGFFLTLRRRRDALRTGARGAVEMILGHGVEDTRVRRQAPEAATRGLLPSNFCIPSGAASRNAVRQKPENLSGICLLFVNSRQVSQRILESDDNGSLRIAAEGQHQIVRVPDFDVKLSKFVCQLVNKIPAPTKECDV